MSYENKKICISKDIGTETYIGNTAISTNFKAFLRDPL